MASLPTEDDSSLLWLFSQPFLLHRNQSIRLNLPPLLTGTPPVPTECRNTMSPTRAASQRLTNPSQCTTGATPRSEALFSTRSFTPEHRFAFDSRVPASSCVQILSHCKVASNRVTALLQPNKHVGHSVLDRKSPKDSISGIYISFRGPQHVRFLSVRSKLQQISWK